MCTQHSLHKNTHYHTKLLYTYIAEVLVMARVYMKFYEEDPQNETFYNISQSAMISSATISS